MSVTVDGVTYTEGEVTITPDTQSIIFTVNGTNFVNLSDSNLLAYANSMPVTEAFDWAINAADGTATKDFTSLLSNFAICNNFEVMYSNEDGANWIGTGIYLTYGVPTSDLDGKIAISMTDSCGDTWNGNAIEVYENSVLVATVTLTEGTSGTWTRKYDPEKKYRFYWVKGSYSGECSFEILIDGKMVFGASTADCAEYIDGYMLYPECNHSYAVTVVEVVDPTCTEGGYTVYECSRCGKSYEADYEDPLGHSFGDDGVCTRCGYDSQNIITIRMNDTYGDGWTENAIEIYADGEMVAAATIDDGFTATWSDVYDSEKEYEFYWVKGWYSDECSFEILFGDEVVFAAGVSDCERYPDGYRVFPVCEHNYEKGEVTPPTCVDDGYTTYTCTICGLSYHDDIVPYLGGHVKGEEEGVVTPPTCADDGYTTYTCAVCGESYEDDYVNALSHTKGECVVTAPDCTEYGYTTYTCTVCGSSFDDDYVAALGHVQGEDGNCTVCGELYSFPVWVAENQITGENMEDILGDGTASYDEATNTLTLNGFTYDGEEAGVYSEIPLNIVLVGENTITSGYDGFWFNIVCGAITISGTGSLTMDSADECIDVDALGDVDLTIGGSVTINMINENDQEGIYLTGNTADLVIKDSAKLNIGTEAAPIDEECIYVNGYISGSVTISGNANVHLETTDEEGIYVYGDQGSITITGGSIYIDAAEEALDANTITISGGTVTAIGGVDYEGIFADDLTITGGTVTARGDDQGIEAENITITGGTVTVTGGGMFASAVDMTPGTITLGQGMAITAPEGATLGELDLTAEDEGIVLAVLNPDGTLAETLVIEAVCHHIDADNSGRCDICDGLMESAKPVMTVKGFSLSFEDEIQVNIYYSVADVTYIVEQGVLVFYSEPGTVDFGMADAVYNEPVANSAGAYYGVSTAGIAAKEMGDTRYYVAYAKLDDGTYVYSNICGYSPKQYAMNMLGKSTTSDKQKVLCVAMLNFGAAAQEYFGYKTDDLMNAELTDEQKALVIPYDKTLFTGAVEADASKVGAFAATASGFAEMGATVSLEGAFSVNYYITPSATVDRDLTLYIWTPEAYAAADILTAENASQTVSMTICGQGSYWGQVKNIAAKGLDDTYYVAGVYTDDSGNTYCTGVIAYSLSKYCINKAVDGCNMQQLAGATAMYGYYAKQYFTN